MHACEDPAPSSFLKRNNNMKLTIVTLLAALTSTVAFAPATPSASTTVTALNAEPTTRAAFLSSAVAAALFVPAVANAGTMAQENVSDPTEVWETGKPSADAKAARAARYANARNQNNSNFAPIKRLTLERKSPVTRLDINAPDFTAYKQTFPGLYKKL